MVYIFQIIVELERIRFEKNLFFATIFGGEQGSVFNNMDMTVKSQLDSVAATARRNTETRQ